MSADVSWPLEGGCDCRQLRYRLTSAPLFVHACHCRWCQRETGSAFALNAMVESDRVEVLSGVLEWVDTPSASGKGQRVARCPRCRLALWSHYGGAGPLVAFLRVGTLDQPDLLPPDIHIFAASRQPWLTLPAEARAVLEYYDRRDCWPAESLRRWEDLQPKIAVWRAAGGANAAPAQREVIVLPPGGGRHYAMGRIAAVFKADREESADAYSISEWWLEPRTCGPGAHSHPEDDVFQVLAGTMSFLVDGRWLDADAGSFVLVPGGHTHDFENRGAVRAGVLNLSIPGGFEAHMANIVDWYREHPAGDVEAPA